MVWTQDRPDSFRCIAHSSPTIVRTALVDLSFQDVVEPATYAANHKSSERVNSAPPAYTTITGTQVFDARTSRQLSHERDTWPHCSEQWGGGHPASERPKLMTLIRPLIRLHLQALKIPLPRRQIGRGMLRSEDYVSEYWQPSATIGAGNGFLCVTITYASLQYRGLHMNQRQQ